MDFDAYVTARRERLVEHALARGCPAEDAPGLVDTVLAGPRRRIARAEDPHPETLAALDEALDPPADRRPRAGLGPASGPGVAPRRRLLLGAALGTVLLAALAVLVTGTPTGRVLPGPPAVRTVPSSFGLDADRAARELERAGFVTRVQPARDCEPRGLVLSTTPPAGSRAGVGSTVTVRSARSPGDTCLDGYDDRAAARAFVGWVRGGPAPAFTTTVNVVVDGQGPRSVYTGGGVRRESFGPVLERLATELAVPAETGDGLPRLLVSSGPPPPQQCGTPRPAPSNDRVSLRLQVDPTPGTDARCPLTVDLFRFGSGEIDAVVVYSAR